MIGRSFPRPHHVRWATDSREHAPNQLPIPPFVLAQAVISTWIRQKVRLVAGDCICEYVWDITLSQPATPKPHETNTLAECEARGPVSPDDFVPSGQVTGYRLQACISAARIDS